MSPVRTCAYTGIFARMGLVFQSLPKNSLRFALQLRRPPRWPGRGEQILTEICVFFLVLRAYCNGDYQKGAGL
jgi:hypothetical protein